MSIPEHFQKLISIAAESENQSTQECFKQFNFYLTYTSKNEGILELIFERIVNEVEEYEKNSSPEYKFHRKNKRTYKAKPYFVMAIKLLVLNTLYVKQLMKEGLFIAISLNSNHYGLNKRYAPSFITYDQLAAAFYGMVQLGYLSIYKHGFFDALEQAGWTTKICAGEKLVNILDEQTLAGIIYIRHPVVDNHIDESILLREEGKLVEYADTSFTKKARKSLVFINEVLARHEYKLSLSADEMLDMHKRVSENYHAEPDSKEPVIDYTATRLYRIFSEGSFKRGGRFYSGWWQNVPKDFRPYITIDGESTVELDYASFHPSILYAEAGLPLVEDAYNINPMVSRVHSKIAFNALLNAKGRPTKPTDFHEEILDEDFNVIPLISWNDFLDMVMAKHQVLTDNDIFLNGYGLTLQFQDSQLAEKILLYFAERDIPCLPIHDSFLVNKEWAEELETVMKREYLLMFGQDINISGR